MSLGDKLNKEVKSWVSVAMIIVIATLILLKFRSANVGNMAECSGGFTYNSSSNLCQNATNFTDTSAVTGQVSLTLDTFVSALSEPKNWVAIVIIALIGFALLKYYRGQSKR